MIAIDQPATPHPTVGSAPPSDDQILEMLLYAEQHSERAALERYQITRRQLSEWRALVGARIRSPEEVQALLRDGEEAERSAKLPEFLRRHNITMEEYMDHKATAAAGGSASNSGGGGIDATHWDTERVGAGVLWMDDPTPPPDSDSDSDSTASQPVSADNGDAIMRRAPNERLTRKQVCYLASQLLEGKQSSAFMRKRYSLGAGIMSAIFQGTHPLLPRILKQQLAANKRNYDINRRGRPTKTAPRQQELMDATPAPAPAPAPASLPPARPMRPKRPARPEGAKPLRREDMPWGIVPNESEPHVMFRPAQPPPLPREDPAAAAERTKLRAENQVLKRIVLKLMLQIEAADQTSSC